MHCCAPVTIEGVCVSSSGIMPTPDLCILTATGDRPLAFGLTERWIARSARHFGGHVRWVVVDDGLTPLQLTPIPEIEQIYLRRERVPGEPSNTMLANIRHALDSGNIQGNHFMFFEDDDWCSEDFLAWGVQTLRSQNLVGEAIFNWFHVGTRELGHWDGGFFSPMSSTMMRGSMLRLVDRLTRTVRYDDQVKIFLDQQIWIQGGGGFRRMPTPAEPPRVVLLKGMPGRLGEPWSGHDPLSKVNPVYKPDPDLSRVRSIMGADADVYGTIYRRET